MTTLRYEHQYRVLNCGAQGCDQHWAISKVFYDETKRTGEGFYCPRGHSLHWTETMAQELEDERAKVTHLQDQLQASAVEKEMLRAELIRARFRFSRGVCPCCNRSFPQLTRHMKTQHPAYDVAAIKTTGKIMYRCTCGKSFETPRGLAIHQGHLRGSDWADPSIPRWRKHLTVV